MTKKGEGKVVNYRKLITIDKCARCGYNEFLCSLQVHHEDGDRNNNDIDNLILLCANCHIALRYGRWKLSDIGLKDVEHIAPLYMRITAEQEWEVINKLGIKFR